ncbi:ArgP/LysG family DNA-binding transcriptional regulator [Psychromonas sp. psych-6C06]|uniref:LysR family transcriptional regulator ArgP n=1 Tax=Psychromonas sp. psych-6C06 TaxID=2058089 RepID=UPI000C33375B|nr:LysR family transcriptional regulator ArgP [Psychromonas sp. psych-6C06]PKF62274.1 ArgP/LysG family DNA-binding transcriptional regulator [Psychromonas sp. psych-6C06]
MQDYKLLAALDAILKTQSFDKAAKQLHISQSAISQRIKLLESHHGQALLIRSHPIKATTLGQKLLGHYQRVLQLESELEVQLKNTKQRQSLPLAVNADSLATWFVSALAPLLQAQQVALNLFVEDESRTWERLSNGEVLACVTSKQKPMSGGESHFLGFMEYVCVATPKFIDRYFSQGFNQVSFQQAPAIIFDQHDDIHLKFLADNFSLQAGQYPCHTVRSSQAFVDLTLADGAYSLNAKLQIEEHLKSGQLVNIMPDQIFYVPLYWQCWQLSGRLISELTDNIIAYCQQVLAQTTNIN